MTADLLPCPFCGGEAQIVPHPDGAITTHHAECMECVATMWGSSTKDDAAAAWNTRPAPSLDVGVVREALEFYANRDNHYLDKSYNSHVWHDHGAKARAALQQLPAVGGKK